MWDRQDELLNDNCAALVARHGDECRAARERADRMGYGPRVVDRQRQVMAAGRKLPYGQLEEAREPGMRLARRHIETRVGGHCYGEARIGVVEAGEEIEGRCFC